MSLVEPEFLKHGRPLGALEYARRMAFLTELDSQTWIARYTAAERLGDPTAVGSSAGYLSWLRRMSRAWAAVPMPTAAQAEAAWSNTSFTSITAATLDASGLLDADLSQLTPPAADPQPLSTWARVTTQPAGSPDAGADTLAPSITATLQRLATQAAIEDVDAAYVCGAVYVAVSSAAEVAVLAADVEHLANAQPQRQLPQNYLRHCVQAAAARSAVRRELADWAAAAGPDPAERVILAARMLTEHLATALTDSTHDDW